MTSQIFSQSQTSNPFSFALAEEDAASIAALRARANHYRKLGLKQEAWRLSVRACEIVNRAMLGKIRTGEFEGEEIYYTEVPDEYPAQENIGLDLNLSLIANSPLAQKIIALLEENARDDSII